MRTVTAEATAEFAGSAAAAYETIADYHRGHPSILPQKYFTGLPVLSGGRGEGTVIRFGMKVAGGVQEAVADVTEPEPGRVLVERVRDEGGTTSTFTVTPVAGGRVRVTIHTAWHAHGLAGLIEGLLAPPLLRRIHREELMNLERVAGAAARQNQEAEGSLGIR